MYRGVTISVVIPCLNEEEGIARTLADLPDYVDEVVVVDNDSTDRTAEVARSLGAVVALKKRRGTGIAKLTGFKTATKDVIVTADGDGTYPLPAIKDLVDGLLDGDAKFVCGCRFPLRDPKTMSHRNFVGNQIMALLMSFLFKAKITDGLSGMYCFRRDTLRDMNLVSFGWNLPEEIKLEAACHPRIGYTERHIEYAERTGESKLTPWKTGLGNVLFLFRKKYFLPKPGRRHG